MKNVQMTNMLVLCYLVEDFYEVALLVAIDRDPRKLKGLQVLPESLSLDVGDYNWLIIHIPEGESFDLLALAKEDGGFELDQEGDDRFE